MNAPLDSTRNRPGFANRLPAALKLPLALAVLLTIVLAPIRWHELFIGIAIGLAGVAAIGRVSPGFILGRLLLFEPLALGVAGLALLSPNGLHVFIAILIKSTLCLLTMILLSATTPFTHIIRVLRIIRVPWLLLTTLTLMYRYLFVLAEEAGRMRRARLSRTFDRGRWRLWKNLGTVLGQLFVRSSERAERIYAAMCARGWK